MFNFNQVTSYKIQESSSIFTPTLIKTKEFIALASMYYTNNFLKFPENSTLSQLKDSSIKFCSLSIDDVIAKYDNDTYADSYC